MVSSITSTTDTTSASAAMKKSIGMNKDDFLKLFIAQLQHQDPLAPQDPSSMLNQLSQLSQLEQSYNSTTALNNLLTAQNNALAMDSVSFIGKSAKAYGNAAVFDGNSPAQLQFSMPSSVASATVTISDAAGNVVRIASLGTTAAGESSYTWDGKDASGKLLPAGTYSFKVAGTTANGKVVAATTYTTGVIGGVDLTSGKPVLTIGSAPVALSDVISIKGV